MNQFELTVEINRPPEQVFALLVDPEKAPDWNPAVTRVEKLGSAPLGLGTLLRYHAKMLGRKIDSTSEITAFVPAQRFSTKTTKSPFHLEIANTLTPTPTGTRLTTLYQGESRGFFKLAEPVMVSVTKRQFEAATENLKALLEAEPA